MYNPHGLKECDKERRQKTGKGSARRAVDTAMTAIGGIASVSSIPQVIKIWETGSVAGISLTTQLIALFAVVSWFLYGMYIKNKPLAIASGSSVLVLGTVVLQMFYYG